MPVRVEPSPSGLVAWVVIEREGKANSLDPGHVDMLAEALAGACTGGRHALVAVRGAGGRYFSAGIDLDWVASGPGRRGALELFQALAALVDALYSCEKPVAAAVNGHALGLGMEIVNLADLAVAVRGARLGVPAVRWGMVPPVTASIAPRLAGAKAASLLALTGATISAEEALAQGLLNAVVDTHEELEEWVESAAARVAEADPAAVAEARRLMWTPRLRARLLRGALALALTATRPETAARASGFRRRGGQPRTEQSSPSGGSG